MYVESSVEVSTKIFEVSKNSNLFTQDESINPDVSVNGSVKLFQVPDGVTRPYSVLSSPSNRFESAAVPEADK